MHQQFLLALAKGIVPAGEEAQGLLYDSDQDDEQTLMDALREVSKRYNAADFHVDRLMAHISHDIALYQRILELVTPITPDKDAKLQTLVTRLNSAPLNTGKCLIFTQYSDTARYLYENLNPDRRRDIEVIYSGDKSKTQIVARFAPVANAEVRQVVTGPEITTLIATDVLAEGLNLQDCDKIINYDLHWNPVRLIQRFGRIDRIGSTNSRIYGYNFLPETGIERTLGLRQKLQRRIQEIHDTIGEDAAILDRSETLNEAAMYAIYEQKGGQLSFFEDEAEGNDDLLDLNEAEEIMRQLRKDNPDEFARIAHLRDGIRTARYSDHKGQYVFCQAGRYQQLYLLDTDGQVISRDVPRILGILKCTPETVGLPLPPDYNATVMRVYRQFVQEVKHRQAERDHTLSLKQSQSYVLRELRVLYGQSEDDDQKAQIALLEKAFRRPLTQAIIRELNTIRRDKITDRALILALADIYTQHNMRERVERDSQDEGDTSPRIICSEGLV